jgi:TetR/AcrR family transcriptional regulator
MKTQKIRPGRNVPAVQKRLKADERRRQLLEIAKEMFSEHGFENTSTRSIAAAAGVSEAIVFRHFVSKEDLYRQILDRKADEIDIKSWSDELEHIAEREDDEALVRSVMKHVLEADMRDPQVQRLLLHAALSGHPLHKITAQRLLPLHGFLSGYIEKRQKKGAFQNRNPKLAAYAIVSLPAYYGLAKILFGVDELELSQKRLMSGFTQLLMEGLNAPIGSSQKNECSGKIPKSLRTEAAKESRNSRTEEFK